jgi:hypothetical protein
VGWATALDVNVVDSRRQPVSDAVIVAVPNPAPAPASPPESGAVMDQIHKAFVPGVLVVRTGTSVVFPNSDTIAHQVYSFSPPKRFKLPLRWAGDLPAGKYRISVWTPQSTRDVVQFEQDVTVGDSPSQHVEINLPRAAASARAPDPDPRVREY